MSFKAFVWAWDAPVEKAEHLLVLLALADIANDAGQVRAGAPYIAKKCRREERAVRRTLQALVELSVITMTERPGKVPLIALAIPDEFVVRFAKDQEHETGKRGRPKSAPITANENPGHPGENPGHLGLKPSPTVSDEPIIEPRLEPERANALVASGDDVRRAFDAFNAMVAGLGGSPARALNDDRRRRIKARLKDCGGLEAWCALIARVPESPFLRGDTHHHFAITLDFLLQPSSFTKLAEGQYHDQRSQTDGQPRQPSRHPGATDFAAERAEARAGAMLAGAQKALDGGGRRRWRL